MGLCSHCYLGLKMLCHPCLPGSLRLPWAKPWALAPLCSRQTQSVCCEPDTALGVGDILRGCECHGPALVGHRLSSGYSESRVWTGCVPFTPGAGDSSQQVTSTPKRGNQTGHHCRRPPQGLTLGTAVSEQTKALSLQEPRVCPLDSDCWRESEPFTRASPHTPAISCTLGVFSPLLIPPGHP